MLFVSISLFAASASAAPSYKWATAGPITSTTSINGNGALWGINAEGHAFYCKDYKNCGAKPETDSSKEFTKISHNTVGITCGISKKKMWCNNKPDSAYNEVSGKPVPAYVQWSEYLGSKEWKDVSITNSGALYGITTGNQIFYCPTWSECNGHTKGSDWNTVPTPGLPTNFMFSQISSFSTSVVCGLEVSSEEPNKNGRIFCASKTGIVWSDWQQLKGSLNEISVNENGSLWGVKKNKQIYYCAYWKNCLLNGSGNWNRIPGQLSEISSAKGSAAGTICGVGNSGKTSCASF